MNPLRQSIVFVRILSVLTTILMSLALTSAAQSTIHVPTDQATIQTGINAAQNGDTVLVAPGTYKENVNFQGKAITLTTSGGPSATTIDGGQNGAVVTFSTGEGLGSTLKGFTIQNGGIANNPNAVSGDGVLVQGASPTITGNVITMNNGYGIEIDGGYPYIQGNTISYTATQYNPFQDYGCDYDDGSGISILGDQTTSPQQTTIVDNTIEYNVAHCGGGAIRMNSPGNPLIENNIMRYNQTLGGDGGAVYLINGDTVMLIQNLIYGNVSAGSGGGVYLSFFSELNGNSGPIEAFLVQNTIVGNTIAPNPGLIDDYEDGSQVGFGGYVSQTGLYNNIIVAADTYSAIACFPVYSYLSATPPVVWSSNVYNYIGQTFGGWCTASAGQQAGTYSLNTSANPQFVTGGSEFFHLAAGSPAAAAGYISAPKEPTTDLDGSPRFTTVGGITNVDQGVYEGAAGTATPYPALAMSLGTNSLTLASTQHYGVAASDTITLSSSGGFVGTVTLSCTNLPTTIAAACYFSEKTVAFGGDNASVTVQVVVEDQSAVADLREPHPLHGNLVGNGISLCMLLPGIPMAIFLATLRRRLPASFRMVAFIALSVFLFTVSACGGGGGAGGGGGSGGGGGTGGGGGGTGGGNAFSLIVLATGTGNASLTQQAQISFTVSQ